MANSSTYGLVQNDKYLNFSRWASSARDAFFVILGVTTALMKFEITFNGSYQQPIFFPDLKIKTQRLPSHPLKHSIFAGCIRY